MVEVSRWIFMDLLATIEVIPVINRSFLSYQELRVRYYREISQWTESPKKTV